MHHQIPFSLALRLCGGFKCLFKTLAILGNICATDPPEQNMTQTVCLHSLTFDFSIDHAELRPSNFQNQGSFSQALSLKPIR